MVLCSLYYAVEQINQTRSQLEAKKRHLNDKHITTPIAVVCLYYIHLTICPPTNATAPQIYFHVYMSWCYFELLCCPIKKFCHYLLNATKKKVSKLLLVT